jgi:hypothetical protein
MTAEAIGSWTPALICNDRRIGILRVRVIRALSDQSGQAADADAAAVVAVLAS